MEIKINIKNCSECPFFNEKRMYTADSFEEPYDWFCKKAHGRKIAGYVEWNDKIAIPDWCPCKITSKKIIMGRYSRKDMIEFANYAKSYQSPKKVDKAYKLYLKGYRIIGKKKKK